MPIVKCPKCGEEYNSMYSFHSCKKDKEGKKGDSILKVLDENSYTPYRGISIKSSGWRNLGLPLTTVGLVIGIWYPPAILIFGGTAILLAVIGMFRQK